MNTHKILLVDASGSMCTFVKETQATITSILKQLDSKTHFTLVYFDSDEYNVVADNFGDRISEKVADLYYARGMTPITDALYKSIQDITKDISDIEHLNEPHKIIVFTDGLENDSRHVTNSDLRRAIDHFSSLFGWDFQFIGPGSCADSITAYTNDIKIKKENVSLYADVKDGLRMMEQKTIN